MLKQDKRRPLIQAAPSLQSGSAAPPKPVGVSRTPHAHLWQEERGVPEQKQRAPAQQLLEQRVFVVALRLKRQRPEQGQVPAQPTEQLQVKHSALSHFVFTLSAGSRRRPHVFCFCAPHAGSGTVRAARTPTAELGAARAATHPFAKEGEIRPASWRPAGSPGNRFPLFLFCFIEFIYMYGCVWI